MVHQAHVQAAPPVEVAPVGPQAAQQMPAAVAAKRQIILAHPQMRDPVLQLMLLSNPKVKTSLATWWIGG